MTDGDGNITENFTQLQADSRIYDGLDTYLNGLFVCFSILIESAYNEVARLGCDEL
ncbi:MAG: hypothetical protein F6K42_29925 [Leptolyngbya sp. SIO1D8]|nr:hypothetical protein [Leptolyngbya sp. SIO1D8]